jgi:hypothetical protein
MFSFSVNSLNIPTSVSVPISIFNLTRFGRELHSLSEGFERDTKYEQEFIAFLKLRGATVQRAIMGFFATEDV